MCTFRISSGERESLRMSARLCAWLRLSVPLVVRSAPLSGPHPSQMMTRGGLQLTSNHTRVTYWKGSSVSLCVPKLRPCGVTYDVSLIWVDRILLGKRRVWLV